MQFKLCSYEDFVSISFLDNNEKAQNIQQTISLIRF